MSSYFWLGGEKKTWNAFWKWLCVLHVSSVLFCWYTRCRCEVLTKRCGKIKIYCQFIAFAWIKTMGCKKSTHTHTHHHNQNHKHKHTQANPCSLEIGTHFVAFKQCFSPLTHLSIHALFLHYDESHTHTQKWFCTKRRRRILFSLLPFEWWHKVELHRNMCYKKSLTYSV